MVLQLRHSPLSLIEAALLRRRLIQGLIDMLCRTLYLAINAGNQNARAQNTYHKSQIQSGSHYRQHTPSLFAAAFTVRHRCHVRRAHRSFVLMSSEAGQIIEFGCRTIGQSRSAQTHSMLNDKKTHQPP